MTTSLSTLRTKARRYLNETTANRWTNVEIDAYINEAIVFVQGEIERANPEWFVRVSTFTASAGSYQSANATDIWGNKLRTLLCYPNSTVATGVPYTVPPGQLEWIMENVYYSGDKPEAHVMLAGFFRWAPMLTYDSTFRYVYAKKETALSADDSNLDRIADEHADLIAMYAAMIAYEKVGANTQWLSARFDRGLQKMRWDVQESAPLTIPQQSID